MRTNTFIKALAFAMLLATACNKNEIANDENTEKKGFALPVTVNVTREGDDATKATYNESTRTLEFSAGDKLFVKGNDYSAGGAGFFAGTLTWQSGGTFSGTILTENTYSGTIDALFTAGSALATLLPANYGNYPYLSFDDEGTYSASVNYDATKTFATSKATAVEQFSFEVGGYTSGTGFALHPANAILNFTGVDVALSDGVSFTISGSVTTDDSGTATFAIGVNVGTDLKDWTLTVAGNAITLVSSSKVLATGKIYNINRAAPVVTNLSTINANYTASDGETLTGTLASNVKISIADGATVTLDGVTINGTHSTSYKWAGITCLGDATIILKDESVNSVVGFCYTYPGIYIPHGKTLTIQGETLGTGVLNATGAGYSAGIGAASESVDIYRSCGNIVIAGGVINATAGGERAAGIGCGGTTNPSTTNPSTCGTINITGGTITATGGKWAPGIGSGFYATCGDITIANTVTSVIATKGAENYSSTFDCIGKGREGSCGTVKFGNQTMYNGSSWTTTPTSGSTYGGLNLTISQTTYANDTWTLTPVLP